MKRAQATAHFRTIRTEGGLLPLDLLQRVAAEDRQLSGMGAEAYHLDPGERIRDAVNRAWTRLTAAWRSFQTAVGKLPETHSATAETRERWLLPLFDVLGYGRLPKAPAHEIEGKSYAISHGWGQSPIHLLGSRVDLDTRQKGVAGAAAVSPHGLVQDFLNRSDRHLWGFVSNGLALRILRDHHSLTQQAYVEFDLQAMMEGAKFSDFRVLWLLCHQSRLEAEKPEDCLLEKWFQTARDEGVRALDQLRDGVEKAIAHLGSGFLKHKANRRLHDELAAGTLDKQDYYRQLLRLVYRLIFVFVAEDRGALLLPEREGEPAERAAARDRYHRFYSTRRLRELADKRRGGPHGDLWQSLRLVLHHLHEGSPVLALPALGSFLFHPSATSHLNDTELANEDLLNALRALCYVERGKVRHAVSYRNVGSEELGSVYESLLERHPRIHRETGTFELSTAAGHERKTTGSYYTPRALVDCLLDSALEPVLDEAARKPDAEKAILDLKVCDPACGSGHFLVAAARRLALRLASVRSGGDEPSPPEVQRALRDVVGRCIFGVDLNPMAVELCKVSLWMEAIEPGKPLSFLEAHIRQGNALLGTTPALMERGIPDEAFQVIEGDDKEVAKRLKKRNRDERKGKQMTMFADFAKASGPVSYGRLSTGAAAVEADADDSLVAVRKKEEDWERFTGSEEYRAAWFLADAWCAAFVWPKQPGPMEDGAITHDLWLRMQKDPGVISKAAKKEVQKLAREYSFFHWHLAFPQVFSVDKEKMREERAVTACVDGFDVMLGNPPWIAHAGRAAQPLPSGVKTFLEVNYESFADYPTTHGVFVGLMPSKLRAGGRLGLIIPSSLSELGGYAPTRRAHDRLCEFTGELIDFGEGKFPGVTQPCMALASRRVEGGRKDAKLGEPWPMARPDLSAVDRQLLHRLAAMPTIPAELFGERGLQSDKTLAEHFLKSSEPSGRFTCPIREGTDVREFELLPPRYHVDRRAVGSRMRSEEEFRAVRIVVRQTARYPIVAISDGVAFRNSLLAVFDASEWPRAALVALLNSALVRWAHYMRFRDARQPIMPQVKIGHLRAIPAPPGGLSPWAERLAQLGERLAHHSHTGQDDSARIALDDLVAEMYRLTPEERAAVAAWHAVLGPSGGREPDGGASSESPPGTRAQKRGRPRNTRGAK